MSMRDRLTTSVHGGSPQGLPSSKSHTIIFLVGLGECARDLTKCVVCKKTLTWS